MIVGGGARSHALGEALQASPSVGKVVFAPGTTGLEALGYETAPVASQDLPGLVDYALMEEIDLTVIGPNTPLVDGVVDLFEAAKLPIFGPSKAAARLEGSKAYARLLMQRLGIPTPRFAVCDTADRAMHLARTQSWARVFKADGIAYDKGVRVTRRFAEVEDALQAVMYDNVYGLESERIVVEERIDGEEITLFTLTDGHDVVLLGHVSNSPRLHDGDMGPPTRGMGQVSPASQLDDELAQGLVDEVIVPIVRRLAELGRPLRGALFADLMLRGGESFVIDYNVRFGDPATQTLLSALQGDFYEVLQACRRAKGLQRAVSALRVDPRPRVSVVLACEGYPQRSVRGARIQLEAQYFSDNPDLRLYLDGVRWTGDYLETTGGRTCTVVAAGSTVAEARERAYTAADTIRFKGRHLRGDIGYQLGSGRP